MQSLNVLHLSDFHIGNYRYPNPATSAIKIANTLNDNGRKVDIVIVSGDIFDGRRKEKDFKKDEEYAIKLFKTLIERFKRKEISEDNFDENCILFVPGNHDLIRKEGHQKYERYDSFINAFYPSKKSNKVIPVDEYNFICDFPEKKIAILGFNSCRIEIEKEKEEDLKWIEDINLKGFKAKQQKKIKNTIKAFKEEQTSWDDFGHIDPTELDNVFQELTDKIPSYVDYTLVATFHHHFYPFPERVGRTPDASFIRNYTDVLDQFQRFNVRLVLHGHKHTPVRRAITDNKYFDNPSSIIYVLAAGSVGCKGVDNPSFQWLKVYDKSNIKLVEGEKYDFNDEELRDVKEIILPPQRDIAQVNASNLLLILQNESPKLYNRYVEITNDFEQKIQDSDIEKLIEVISGLLTIFDDVRTELRKTPRLAYLTLLTINYRVICLKEKYEKDTKGLCELLKRIEDEILREIVKKDYAEKLITFLGINSNEDLDKHYPLIIKNVTNKQKKIGAYASIALFITDLFLNISRYGEYYFEKEKLNHKINIKLQKDNFYDKLPSNSISVNSNIDRRAIIFDFKCKNPTVHKIAVLIVKDFEMRLNKFEESLKTIRLKLYYIFPKVTSEGYDLENFHFEAYIPTLLPLLTGDNLYKQKEVFIRELVQNAIDATLLRKKLEPNKPFNMDIDIEMGEEDRRGEKVKYFNAHKEHLGDIVKMSIFIKN